MRVLLVDDHAELLALLTTSLERDGHRVVAAGTLEDARRAIEGPPFDVIVLDVALPDGSGIELCRQARGAQMDTPILLLTAHAAVDERVEGLDAGADDFMGKPFAVAELRARVRALGRRKGLPGALRWERGDVVLDFSRRRATVGASEVPLTAREWGILEVLAAGRGHVVARGRILDEGWGQRDGGAGSSLEVLVGRIRKKLGEDVIRTVRGEGYALG